MFMTLRDQGDPMNSQAAVWYEEGISKLVSRYDKCLNVQGDMWGSRWRCMIKPAYSVSFLLSINIFVWQNVLYFLDAHHKKELWRSMFWLFGPNWTRFGLDPEWVLLPEADVIRWLISHWFSHVLNFFDMLQEVVNCCIRLSFIIVLLWHRNEIHVFNLLRPSGSFTYHQV